jgi:hypothetical protein
MRVTLLLFPLLLAACRDEPEPAAAAAANAVPPLERVSEKPGEWNGLDGLVGRTPMDSGLIESSSVSVDLSSALGPDLSAFQAAMMRAGPLTRLGPLLVTRADNAWLVLHPADRAFHAALLGPEGWREWHTAGAEVPIPRELRRAASDPASAQRER